MSRFKLSTFLLWSLISIFLIVSYSAFLFYLLDSWDKRASFGSMFGAISTLFAGLSFAGVIYTLNVQREEIRNNQKVYDSKIKEQNRLNFENKYFILYNDLIKSSDRLSVVYNNKQFTNHQFFEGAYYKLRYIPDADFKKIKDLDTYKFKFILLYNSYIHNIQHDYTFYINKLFFILKFIDNADILYFNDKLFYSELISNELNSFSKILLRYHSIYKEMHGNPEWKILFKKYNLIDNVSKDYLFNIEMDNILWNL